MQTLFPPDYPTRPDAPLLSFGMSFAEEISRSVIAAVVPPNQEHPHESDVRVAASLTMLEAFHPRDHLECMLAAQGVASHAAIMECFRRSMHPDTSEAIAIKLRANVAQLSRTFSLLVHDLEKRQLKPLPERPPEPPRGVGPLPGPSGGLPDGVMPLDASAPPERASSSDQTPAVDETAEADEMPEDIVTRPDGTPGSLAAYAPKAPEEVYVAREPAIMLALATRPKPWRMVNKPLGEAAKNELPLEAAATTGQAVAPDVPLPARPPASGPLTDKIFSGDALARFASARFDPDAPVEALSFEDDDAMVELELISTGGDPEAEKERAEMMAAHPEGKPIVTYRYGRTTPPKKPPDDA